MTAKGAVMDTIALRAFAVAILFSLPQAALAQAQTPPAQPASAPSRQLLTSAQLDALVSPIALYPDALLSEILMASTYPLEIVEADRWTGPPSILKRRCPQGARLISKAGMTARKLLVATPDALDMMS